MASSTEDSDSRTAAFSKKRKQLSSLNTEQFAAGAIDKRIKLEYSNDSSEHRRLSNWSAEISTSTASTRRPSNDSATTPEDHEIEDLDPERAAHFSWKTIKTEPTHHGEFGNYVIGQEFDGEPQESGPTFSRSSSSVDAARADSIANKLYHGKVVTQSECVVIAQWLHVNDLGLRAYHVQHAGLKARILEMIREKNLNPGTDVAKVLEMILQKGDYSSKARAFLKERYASVRSYEMPLRTVKTESSSFTNQQVAADAVLSNAPNPDPRLNGLIHLDAIMNRSLKQKVITMLETKHHASIEEILRHIVVYKGAHHRQAERLLTDVYQQRGITGEKRDGISTPGGPVLSLEQLERRVVNTAGFSRPMIGFDVSESTPGRVVSVAVGAHMYKFSNSTFAAALLELAKDSPFQNSAKQCLSDFININYVSGDHNTTIHSRDGLERLLKRTSSMDTVENGPSTDVDNAVRKLNEHGSLALTLDELEYFLPEPSDDKLAKSARKKAKSLEYIQEFWKKPHVKKNHLVARCLLQLLKAGTRIPKARECLNRFVQALQGNANQIDETREDVEMQDDDDDDESQHSPMQEPSQPLSPREDELALLPHAIETVDATPTSKQTNNLVADLKHTLSDTTSFTRPIRISDLVTDSGFVAMATSMRKDLRWPLQQVLLYLANGDSYADAAQRTLIQYVDQCRLPSRPSTAFDYGELAREAAAKAEADTPPASDEAESVQQQHAYPIDAESLQRRYFHTTFSNSVIRCLSCGKEGHMEDACPSRTCSHCGAIDQHFSSACPANHKCRRCRQRGHTTAACISSSISLPQGLHAQCDLCGRLDHVEEECSELWRSSIDDDAIISQIPRQEMKISCYNCGASGPSAHWGDDCPRVISYHRNGASRNPTWSKKYADKYISSTTWPEPRAVAGYGSVPSYQLALLGDM